MKLFVFVGNVTQNAGAVCPEDRLADWYANATTAAESSR